MRGNVGNTGHPEGQEGSECNKRKRARQWSPAPLYRPILSICGFSCRDFLRAFVIPPITATPRDTVCISNTESIESNRAKTRARFGSLPPCSYKGVGVVYSVSVKQYPTRRGRVEPVEEMSGPGDALRRGSRRACTIAHICFERGKRATEYIYEDLGRGVQAFKALPNQTENRVHGSDPSQHVGRPKKRCIAGNPCPSIITYSHTTSSGNRKLSTT